MYTYAHLRSGHFPPIFRQKVDFESSKVSRGYEICINVFDFIADQFCWLCVQLSETGISELL